MITNEKELEFAKLCLSIELMELEMYLQDPKVKFGLECAKLTDPEGYEKTMQNYKDVKQRCESILARC